MRCKQTMLKAVAVGIFFSAPATPATFAEAKDFPPFEKVSEGFKKVISTADGSSLYTIYVNKETNQMLAELPRGFASQRHFFAMTISSGDMWAGLQSGDMYVYWKRYNDRLALIEPEVGTRSTGDQESKSSVARHFTDRVILDVPIVCMGPGGSPVIDMDALLIGSSSKFFGRLTAGANSRLATIAKAKAFPQNVELAFEVPVAGGRLKTFHYSISLIPNSTGYKPRVADTRIGYFTTTHRDLGKYNDDDKWIRYINRWKLEKAAPKLKISPPKEPIKFYIEHTVPIRYRRWVREGILHWNKAFEEIGITNAIEVYYQDASTKAHMDKDPEDVRYNFIRWLSNDVGTAIGPSRVHPLTGQILDADVVLTDGWIRHFNYQFHKLLPDLAIEGFSPETLAWLEQNPQWDPRIVMAPPSERQFLISERAKRGVQRLGGHPISVVDSTMIGDQEYDGLVGRVSQVNGYCMAGQAKSMAMSLMRMHLEITNQLKNQDDGVDDDDGNDEGDDKPDEPEGDIIDGMPDWFVGPMLADLVTHEVGHTLGLRHNFKSSSAYSLAEINSEEFKGKKAFATSVMDYIPININMDSGEAQGDYTMISIGPYDYWAIEYGYTIGDTKEILKRVAEPELQYGTDEDTWGPDPLARRYDFTANPIEYAENQMRLIKYYRENMLESFVEDGDSWSKSRDGYHITLSQQMSMISMMANWIGGTYVYRDKKGDVNGRAPIEVVDKDRQRKALDFVIENAFNDEAFGLSTDLLAHMTVDKWLDAGGGSSAFEDPSWPVHDRIRGIQSSAMTMILNPTTLKRVYDNEFRLSSDEDTLTLPEVIQRVVDATFSEFNADLNGATYTNRKPMITSLRRSLQSEVISRLIRFATDDSNSMPRPMQTLSTMHLRELSGTIEKLLGKAEGGQVDAYTKAHLINLSDRIKQAMEQVQVKLSNAGGFGGFVPF